jgi:hypothetical protein
VWVKASNRIWLWECFSFNAASGPLLTGVARKLGVNYNINNALELAPNASGKWLLQQLSVFNEQQWKIFPFNLILCFLCSTESSFVWEECG